MNSVDRLRAARAGMFHVEREALAELIKFGGAPPEVRLLAAVYGICPDCGSAEPCGHGES